MVSKQQPVGLGTMDEEGKVTITSPVAESPTRRAFTDAIHTEILARMRDVQRATYTYWNARPPTTAGRGLGIPDMQGLVDRLYPTITHEDLADVWAEAEKKRLQREPDDWQRNYAAFVARQEAIDRAR
jgi:hypothetical protein